jgi:serine/threonine protein kinase
MRFSNSAKDLLEELLEKDPKKRITPKTALQHKFFRDNKMYHNKNQTV